MNEPFLCVCIPVQFGHSCVAAMGVIAAWNRKSVGQNNNDFNHDLLHPSPYPDVCVFEIEESRKGKKQGKSAHSSPTHTHACTEMYIKTL